MLNDFYHMLDPVAISAGPITIYWYGLAYVVGALLTAVVMYRTQRRWGFNITIDDLTSVVVGVVFGLIIGARLFYVVFYGDGYYWAHPLEIFATNEGGMSFHGGLVGGIIGGLGPALSDLISGYPQWAIFTFVIDGLQAVLVGLLVKKFNPANIIIGSVIAGVWKVFGYFIAGGILSGFGPALGEIAGNSFQMAVGLIVGFALFTAVRQAYPPLVRLGNLGIKAGE